MYTGSCYNLQSIGMVSPASCDTHLYASVEGGKRFPFPLPKLAYELLWVTAGWTHVWCPQYRDSWHMWETIEASEIGITHSECMYTVDVIGKLASDTHTLTCVHACRIHIQTHTHTHTHTHSTHRLTLIMLIS